MQNSNTNGALNGNNGVIFDSTSNTNTITRIQPDINFAQFVDLHKKSNGVTNGHSDMGGHIGNDKNTSNGETLTKAQLLSEKPTYKKNIDKATMYFNKSNIGNGVEYKGKKFVTHTNLDYDKSALKTFETWQAVFFGSIILMLVTSLILNLHPTLVFVLATLTFIYFIDLIFNAYLILKSLHFPPEMNIDEEEIAELKDEELPVYTILCPLYKEANVLAAFCKAISKLDWPQEKLDVLLLLEEDDEETIKKANSLNLSENFTVLVVPDSLPKTKPKACNYGFAYAKGEFVVIYDAEDRPDPLQLKKAFIAFNKVDPKVVCLQCKLNYYNPDHNLLTKLFTAEYSLWFNLALPALQSINTTLPLGGTSNHFRSSALRFLGAWDPFNVTEDCDLGTRLFKEGFKTAIINSTTYEEANSKVNSWIKQRSRWIKGYLQTYLVHMRDPIDFVKKHGVHALVFQMVIGMRMVFILINPLMWLMTLSYFMFTDALGPFIESLFPSFVFYVAVFCLVFGNFMYFYNYMIGLAKKRQWQLIKYVFFIPFYWVMTSVSAVIAFYQLIVKPHHWEKTEHGLHLLQPKFALPKFKLYVDFSLPFDAGFISRLPDKIYSAFYIVIRNFYDLMDILGEIPSLKKSKRGKLRILILNWRDTKHVWAGGAEVYVQEIGKQWAKDGHSVTMFSGWDGKGSRNDTIDGVNIIRRGGLYTVYPFAFLYYLLKLRGKFDVVIDCENGIPFFAPFFIEVPIVLLIHHIHQDYFRKHLKFPLSFLAKQLEASLMPVLYRNFPTVTVSESSKRDIVNVGWGKEENIHIINPGIDCEKFGLGEKTPHPSLVYFGRLEAYKNIDLAIRAFKKILVSFPEAKLSIAGGGGQLGKLEQLSKTLGIEDFVIFHGRVDDETRKKILSESWVALQPSSYEGWGITVLEANACGTPVVASLTKGLRDSVRDGETGYLFNVCDEKDFVEKITELLSDENLRKEMSQKAYEWSRQFSWIDGANKFLNVIASDLKGRRRKVFIDIPAYLERKV